MEIMTVREEIEMLRNAIAYIESLKAQVEILTVDNKRLRRELADAYADLAYFEGTN
jgi:cell shape-determining protein MreC